MEKSVEMTDVSTKLLRTELNFVVEAVLQSELNLAEIFVTVLEKSQAPGPKL